MPRKILGAKLVGKKVEDDLYYLDRNNENVFKKNKNDIMRHEGMAVIFKTSASTIKEEKEI